MDNKIYKLVCEIAKEQAGESEITIYNLLFGYSKICSMDEVILKSMLDEMTEEEVEQELRAIRVMMDTYNMNVPLMRDGIPVFLLKKDNYAVEVERCKKILEVLEKENASTQKILEAILESDAEEVLLFTNKHNLDDIFEYIDNGKISSGKVKKIPTVVKRDWKKPEVEEKDVDEEEPEEDEELIEEQVVSAQTSEEAYKPGEQDENRAKFKKLVSDSKELYSTLLSKVHGQDDAVRMFVEGYFQAELLHEKDMNSSNKPSATFLFAGPPGVGKTYLSSCAADTLGYPFKRFDMSEYSSRASVTVFSGADKNYKSPQPGKVTQFVEEHPKCILLFDEIEKANIEIIYQFLQILDAGVLTDNCTEKQVSFKDTILIFTTNVGRSLYEGARDKKLSALPGNVVLDAIRTEENSFGEPIFPEAICSRFASGNIILFNHLGVHNLTRIAQEKFDTCIDMIQEEFGYKISLDPMLSTVFLLNQSGDLDARIVSGKAQMLIKNELYEFGRHVKEQDKVFGQLEHIKFMVEMPKKESEVYPLLVNNTSIEVLVVSDHKVSMEEVPQDRIHMIYANSLEEMTDILKTQDVEIVVIDIMYSKTEQEVQYLSQDDIHSVGTQCFDDMCEKLPQVPVYLLENAEMDLEDEATFLRRGARGFIALDKDGAIDGKKILEISEQIYMQNCVNNLVSRGRVLSYNTAQYLSDDNKKAVVRFYDFKLKTAYTGDSRKLMLSEENKPTEKFVDVIGAEDAKSELEYFVKCMKNPKQFLADGMKMPKGILLYGPPGTGKTMLARAMAGESNVTFLPTTAAGFLNKFVGEGERSIRELFAKARRYAPAIIFIDEIDAIGKERTGSFATQSQETLLNTLLTEMDGFTVDLKHPVFVLAATNYDLDGTKSGKQSALDGALLRRFDNRIFVELPKEEERELFIQKTLQKKHLECQISDAVIRNIAKRTTGESLAILQNILELAIRNAAKNGVRVNDTFLLNALEEFKYGEKREWNDEYYRKVAVHESGHAYMSWKAKEKPSFVTIVSRGDFGGYMQPENGEKTPNLSKEQLIWKIRTALAGRASELVFFGEEEGINTGASSDLRMATNYAINMICQYGMADNSLFSLDPSTVLQGPLATQTMAEVNKILHDELNNTINLIKQDRILVEKLSGKLLKDNQLVGEDIERILNSASTTLVPYAEEE